MTGGAALDELIYRLAEKTQPPRRSNEPCETQRVAFFVGVVWSLHSFRTRTTIFTLFCRLTTLRHFSLWRGGNTVLYVMVARWL